MSTLSKAMKKLEAAALLVLIPIMLAACAHPQLIDLGTAESQVVQKLGEPNATVPLADGRTRLVYSQQPFGQECWWMTFSADGRFEKLENVLNREHFALIKPGRLTEADVWNLFGQYAEKYEFRLKNQHAWMYRFKDEGIFDMAFWVQFDTRGIVAEVGYTLDPYKDRDHWLFP